MPKISLRAYEKQIEEMIEQNRLQKAVDHCRHILKIFPKCISTYRILGKSFLEGKQYPNCADVFKRVLAVYPDDFIAHVGMSIVRESEGNLDAAIWHMELAFDSQPSNIAIQEELKRLFGARDGTHPAKIRLTRGALVRMYARGELYPQAIAEIKSALAEDPKRLDLRVLLAKMNFLLGDSTESLNLCNQLILELPYCYEINKIFVTLLPSSSKSEKTPIYLDRLKALNPYEAFVGEKYLTEAEVPEEQVMLDSLDEAAPSSANESPDWVQAIATKWEEPSSIDTLDWLPQANKGTNKVPTDNSSVFREPQPENQPSAQVQSPAETPTNDQTSADDQLPDWMRNAGWAPTNEPAGSAEAEQSIVSDQTGSEVTESADVPDWLRSLSPEAPVSTPEPKTAFTVDSEPASEPSAENNAAAPVSTQPTGPQPPENNDDLPDWLKNFEIEATSEPETKDDFPEWMKTIEETDLPIPTNVKTERKPFTKSLGPHTSDLNSSEPLRRKKAILNEASPNTHNLAPATSDSGESEKTLAPNSPALPDGWKSSLIEEPVEEEKPQENANTDIPDWVRSVLNETSAKTESEPIEQIAAENQESDQTSQAIEPRPEAESSSASVSEKSGDDLLSWLRDLKPEEESVLAKNAEPEAIEPITSGDNAALDDNLPLDRLEELTGLETEKTSDEATVAEPSVLKRAGQTVDEDSVEPAATAEEPVSSQPVEPETEAVEVKEPEVKESEVKEPEVNEPKVEEPEISSDVTIPAPARTSHKSIITSTLKELTENINSKVNIEQSIEQLVQLTRSHSKNYLVWQLLGDAYARVDNFTEALDSYNKAEELILKL
jgi:tetratricopeptide (TPR) repeat protein